MILKELMRVMPGYITVYVHDKKGNFARRSRPPELVDGFHAQYGEWKVCLAVPISSYTMEVTIEEVQTDD